LIRALLLAAISTGVLFAANGPLNLSGQVYDPFSQPARARVFIFVRTDCPITNRYAPELSRIAAEFSGREVEFWIVYPDVSETPASIRAHLAAYHFPGQPLRDIDHRLVRRAHVTVAPEAAVFNSSGALVYHGRIDDRYVDWGKARAQATTHDLENAIAAVIAGRSVRQSVTRAIGCSLADVE
jgi:hypothetical protein